MQNNPLDFEPIYHHSENLHFKNRLVNELNATIKSWNGSWPSSRVNRADNGVFYSESGVGQIVFIQTFPKFRTLEKLRLAVDLFTG